MGRRHHQAGHSDASPHGSPKQARATGATGQGSIKLQQSIGLPSACAIIVGTIIGSGIFVSPKGVVREVGSVGLALTVWLGSGLLTMVGAFTYSELGTMIPQSGGAYAYIRTAFGGLCGFMYMWAISVIIIPSQTAIIAMTFAQYLAQPFFVDCNGVPPAAITLLGVLAIGKSQPATLWVNNE